LRKRVVLGVRTVPIDDIEKKWNGIINRSALIVAKQVDKHYREINKINAKIKQMKYFLGLLIISWIIFVSINTPDFSILDILAILDLRIWTKPSNFLILLLIILSFCWLISMGKKAQENQENYIKDKELLIRRIDAEFCACSTRCNHKEEFMEDMEKNCGIILYY